MKCLLWEAEIKNPLSWLSNNKESLAINSLFLTSLMDSLTDCYPSWFNCNSYRVIFPVLNVMKGFVFLNLICIHPSFVLHVLMEAFKHNSLLMHLLHRHFNCRERVDELLSHLSQVNWFRAVLILTANFELVQRLNVVQFEAFTPFFLLCWLSRLIIIIK